MATTVTITVTAGAAPAAAIDQSSANSIALRAAQAVGNAIGNIYSPPTFAVTVA